MASNNPYKDLNLDRTRLKQAVEELGGQDYSYKQVGNCFHLSFSLNGVTHTITVYEVKNGSTTFSVKASPVVDALISKCRIGESGPVEFAIPEFSEENLKVMLDYLTEDYAKIERDDKSQTYRLIRLKGAQGDTLTLKHYTNKKLHFQGKRAMLSSMAFDMLANVLGYEAAVKQQLSLVNVSFDPKIIITELETRIPYAFDRVSEPVKVQLTTAIAASKVDFGGPDFSYAAFNALRGLEGFMKSELKTAGFIMGKLSFGEYIEESTKGWVMRPMHAEYAGKVVADGLAKCYTLYHAQRHKLFHLGTAAEEIRILPDLISARNIVDDVFSTIEQFCINLKK